MSAQLENTNNRYDDIMCFCERPYVVLDQGRFTLFIAFNDTTK